MKDNKLFVFIDLSNNKLIGKEIIKVMLQFGKVYVKQIDIRGCMFGVDDVVEWLFQFYGLEEVNKGCFSMYINKENFAYRSQKYLKLFMHLKLVT